MLILFLVGGNSVEVITTKQEPNTGDHHIQVLYNLVHFPDIQVFYFGDGKSNVFLQKIWRGRQTPPCSCK